MGIETEMEASDLRGISETLQIPLACRALASQGNLFSRFTDKKAEEICERFHIDADRYGSDLPTLKGTIARSQWYDEHVIAFLESNENAVVFSIGSGLNTMFERVSSRVSHTNWQWIDSDLEDVVGLRKRVFEEGGNRRTVIFDATDPNWSQYECLKGEQPLLVISEAVLVYLDEELVKTVFSSLGEFARNRKKCHILFDWCSPEMVKRSADHPALKKLKSEAVVFKSQMRRPDRIGSYHSGWEVIEESAVVMQRSGFRFYIMSTLFQIFTLGRKVYGLAEAKLQPGI